MTRYDRARSGAFTPMTRDLIMLRDQYQCVMCGGRRGLTIHHRRPRGAGGTRDPKSSSPANGITLCMGYGTNDCHGDIERNRNAARESGYLVYQGHDPATIPLVHQLYGRVTLTDRGTAIRTKEGGE